MILFNVVIVVNVCSENPLFISFKVLKVETLVIVLEKVFPPFLNLI